MRRFIAGLILGLALASAPLAAEWGAGWSNNDREQLQQIVTGISRIAGATERIAQALEKKPVPCTYPAGCKLPAECVR
jgi:hypothetical protein